MLPSDLVNSCNTLSISEILSMLNFAEKKKVYIWIYPSVFYKKDNDWRPRIRGNCDKSKSLVVKTSWESTLQAGLLNVGNLPRLTCLSFHPMLILDMLIDAATNAIRLIETNETSERQIHVLCCRGWEQLQTLPKGQWRHRGDVGYRVCSVSSRLYTAFFISKPILTDRELIIALGDDEKLLMDCSLHFVWE